MSSQPDQPPLEQPPQHPSQVPAEPPDTLSEPPASPSADTTDPTQSATSGSPDQPPPSRPRRRILIGSQRDPAAYRVRPRRDWIPVRKDTAKKTGEKAPGTPPPAPEGADHLSGQPPTAPSRTAQEELAPGRPREIKASDGPVPPAEMPQSAPAPAAPAARGQASPADIDAGALPASPPVTPAQPPPPLVFPEGTHSPPAEAAQTPPPGIEQPIAAKPPAERPAELAEQEAKEPGTRARRGRREPRRTEQIRDLGPAVTRTVPPPSVRQKLSPELEAEFAQALGDVPLDEMIAVTAAAARPALEPESRHTARVIAVQREDVFVELGSREQGILPFKSFSQPPEPGQNVEVVVLRFNSDDGLYELALPGAAAEVGDWSGLAEGMLVEARITGHNAGGLECEVNRLRGFIPVSQVALYRVENLAEFVDQKLTCLVVEVNPQRRRLVLSRRAVLEREKAEARQKLLNSLAPGQVHDGVVRKLMDFGAFVDLGGVDGLLHISQLSWGRTKHPREVLEEGQRVRVRIDKIDPDTGKISLGYKDLLEDPWTAADRKYLPNTRARGRVVKIMEFGAFVELEPGVEGLVHISELSHKRVARVSDVLKEGDEVDVMVLAVDMQARRISLSLKNLTPPPEPEETDAARSAPSKPAEPQPAAKPKKPSAPLRGGLGRSPGGGLFGLKW